MGPLAGIRVVELAGLAPVPFAAMLLSDLGAEVIRIDRPDSYGLMGLDRVMCRNRRSIGLDLKNPDGVEVLLELIAGADVLIEGLRPGVAERLGFGPEVCLGLNPRLVYGRMTGWGQEGPLRDRAGHDINYIALTGALDAIGSEGGKPVPPLNLVGDFGGGALYLVMGILAALLERRDSNRGQVVDAAMVDGAASLMTMVYEMKSFGFWEEARGENLLDGGAPFYDTYETADAGWVAVGALEPRFFAELLERLDIDDLDPAAQYDRSRWGELRDRLTEVFASATRDHWEELFADADACVSPVLSLAEAPEHRYNSTRRVFVEVGETVEPGPAPRFSRTPLGDPQEGPPVGADTVAILRELGHDLEDVERLRGSGAVF